MEKSIKIAISNRHVHLTKEVYDQLFDEDYQIIKNLKQPNEFVTNKVVTIKNGDEKIENVKVLGPMRNYNQVEIAFSDALKLNVKPPVRKSSDLHDASLVTIETEKGSVTLPCCIIAQRHIHISRSSAEKLNIKDGQSVFVKVGKEKKGTMECFFKVTDEGYYELHIDKDDACAFLLNNDDDAYFDL
ncbi:MAG: PduL/EutD family phosphate acyltransferase [Bacilli bacterium]